ncbi:hypothetical protein SEA_MEYRAN_31 [Gordonia phage Meyran]|nr:hypothetical protein SEA_MEYRAN_31 [Gordonia phage Meyran]
MQNWVWLTPLGYVAAAMIAGVFLVWNNRPRHHEVLKAYAEIMKELPADSPARAQLQHQIESQVARITAVSEAQPLSEIDEDLAPPPLAVMYALVGGFVVSIVGTVGAPIAAELGVEYLATALGFVSLAGFGLAAGFATRLAARGIRDGSRRKE